MGVDTVTERSVESAACSTPSWPRRVWWRLRHWVLNLPRFPVALGFLGYLASDTPSLLPRPWYFQGLIGGISALIFYVIGLVIQEIWQLFARWSGFRMTVRPRARTVLRRIWYVVLALAVLAYPFVNAAWHSYVTSYVGEQPPGPLYPLASIFAAILVGALFIGIYHLFVKLTHWVTARLERRVVRVAIARFVAIVVTIVAVVAVFDQVVIRGLLLAAKEQADAVNKSTPTGVFRPASPLRSGGPGSLVPWDSVGADGKSFIASGPNAARVSVVTRDEEAKEPIRVFASVSNDRNLEETKNLVLAEMDRTKAWERKALPRRDLDEHRVRQRVGRRVVRVPHARRLRDHHDAVLHPAVGARPADRAGPATEGRPAAVQGGRGQGRLAAAGPAAEAVRRRGVPRRLRRERGVRLTGRHARPARRRPVDRDPVVHGQLGDLDRPTRVRLHRRQPRHR